MAEESQSSEKFTDEEYASLRFFRFGSLPDRVLPSEMVEEVETDQPHEVPEPPLDLRTWAPRRI